MSISEQQTASRRLARPKWLLAGFWICVFIAIAVVVRRLIALANPGSPGTSAMSSLNTDFARHSARTIAHIVPAAAFVILAVVVLLRDKHSRWIDVLFFLLGSITGLTAYAMSAYAIGGWVERSAVFVFDTWFLYSLARAFTFYVERDPKRTRGWTTRAVGILLGIATTRPVMGVFFSTSRLTHLTVEQFFGLAFWGGFSINVTIVELWLHSKRRAQLQGARSWAAKRNEMRSITPTSPA